MVEQGLRALVVEDDPFVAAFLEDVLLSRNMWVDCISLPGRFDLLLRQSYDVAVVGIDGEWRLIPLILGLLRQRGIPPVLFSAGGNSHWVAAKFPGIPACHYDDNHPERVGDEALEVGSAEAKHGRR